MSKLKYNDMCKINYTARLKDTNEIFDTTIEDIAKEADVYDENILYKPCLVIIGKNWLPEGLEEQLIGMQQGDKDTIAVEAKKGFGLRDRSKIRLIQRREFQKLQIKPKEGMKVELSGMEGRIMKVSSSRVKVDFNHDFAGHDLIYDVEIVEHISDVKDQFVALLEKRLPGVDFSETKIDLGDKIIKVELPKDTRFMEFIQFTKSGVTRDIGELTDKYEKVKFIEIFKIDRTAK